LSNHVPPHPKPQHHEPTPLACQQRVLLRVALGQTVRGTDPKRPVIAPIPSWSAQPRKSTPSFSFDGNLVLLDILRAYLVTLIIIGKQDSETSHRWATCVSFFLVAHTYDSHYIVRKQDSETHHIVGQHAYILHDRVFELPLHTRLYLNLGRF